jgi:hypothetical protein
VRHTRGKAQLAAALNGDTQDSRADSPAAAKQGKGGSKGKGAAGKKKASSGAAADT